MGDSYFGTPWSWPDLPDDAFVPAPPAARTLGQPARATGAAPVASSAAPPVAPQIGFKVPAPALAAAPAATEPAPKPRHAGDVHDGEAYFRALKISGGSL